MHTGREFPPESHTVVKVRRLLTEDIGIEDTHPAVLVASELATNAVLHAATPYRVEISRGEMIRIEVTDGKPNLEVSNGSAKGYGFRIVDQLSHEWGTKKIAGNGKTVWAEVSS